jgi:hypothetical protein
MSSNIPVEELNQTEAKCNVLYALGENYSHLVRLLETKYKVRLREKCIRRIVGGGAGPEEILLLEDNRATSEATEQRTGAAP